MGMNDSETVALIGGGHAFGKFHGACDTGPGADPIDDPINPWAGTCGDPDDPLFGRGPNTYTSGLEGQWTVQPTVWDTEYFESLLAYDWEVGKGPGDKYQWHPVLKPGSKETEVPDITMLTTDVALLMVREGSPFVRGAVRFELCSPCAASLPRRVMRKQRSGCATVSGDATAICEGLGRMKLSRERSATRRRNPKRVVAHVAVPLGMCRLCLVRPPSPPPSLGPSGQKWNKSSMVPCWSGC